MSHVITSHERSPKEELIKALSSREANTLSICSFSEADEIFVSKESVKASVSLASLSHEASQSDDVFLSCDSALLVNL